MSKVKINVNQLNLIIHRQYKLSSQDCGICRNPLVAPTPQKLVKHDASVKEIDLTCNPVLGKCGDAFHKACIDSLIVNGSCVCPNCHNPWSLSKNLDSCVTYGAISDKSIRTIKANPYVLGEPKKTSITAKAAEDVPEKKVLGIKVTNLSSSAMMNSGLSFSS